MDSQKSLSKNRFDLERELGPEFLFRISGVGDLIRGMALAEDIYHSLTQKRPQLMSDYEALFKSMIDYELIPKRVLKHVALVMTDSSVPSPAFTFRGEICPFHTLLGICLLDNGALTTLLEA